MNKKRYIIPSLFYLMMLFSACNDDFSIVDNYTDNTIIYAMLNPGDTAQYVKINKSFLGDLNAYEMAKEADSVQYKYQLDAYLDEFLPVRNNYGILTSEFKYSRRIPLFRTNEIEKSALTPGGSVGIFGTQVNYLYKTKEKLSYLSKYRIVAKIPGKDSVWSETVLPDSIILRSPRIESSQVLNLDQNGVVAEWKKLYYAKINQVVLVFHYKEKLNGIVSDKSVEIQYEEFFEEVIKTPDIATSQIFSTMKLGGDYFYESIGNSIPVKAGVTREATTIDIIVYSGGEELYQYRNVADASSGMGGTKSEYSNIKNGLGIFDFIVTKRVNGFHLGTSAAAQLNYNKYTSKLGFVEVNL